VAQVCLLSLTCFDKSDALTRYWSNSALNEGNENPVFYIQIYTVITFSGLFIGTVRWSILYQGSVHASDILYKRLLEAVLFADIRFHDTVSRGRLLNRFGTDFEGIDSTLSDNFGRSIMYALSAATTIISVSVVGGPPFIIAAALLGVLYWNGKYFSFSFEHIKLTVSSSREGTISRYSLSFSTHAGT